MRKVRAITFKTLTSYWLKYLNILPLVSRGEWCLMFLIGPGSFVWRVQRTDEFGSSINELLYRTENWPTCRTLHFSHLRSTKNLFNDKKCFYTYFLNLCSQFTKQHTETNNSWHIVSVLPEQILPCFFCFITTTLLKENSCLVK